MTPGVLFRYIGRRFAVTLAVILSAVFLIVMIADYVEILRRFSNEAAFTPWLGVRLAAMRAPLLLESVLPFAFLFAAILSLLGLSRTLELVVARASGVSAWGFLAAPFGLAVLLGIASVLLLNPVAVRLNQASEALKAEMEDPGRKNDGRGIWFRQEGSRGPSIIHSTGSSEDGLILYSVEAFAFEPDGTFREKVTAPRARFEDAAWRFTGATVRSAAAAPRQVDTYVLPTSLSAAEVLQATARPDAMTFWALPGFIETADRTGGNTNRFTLAFHTLLARPAFLLAMVLIAATVSLRLSRHGGAWRLVLTGVTAGFLLYVATDIVSDLGGSGIIDPILAAWAPSIVALTFGATALFHQEDG